MTAQSGRSQEDAGDNGVRLKFEAWPRTCGMAHRQEGEFDQDAKESVTVALDGINRMYRKIDNLLANSRVDSDGKTEETTG